MISACSVSAQSLIQSVNSGSLVTGGSSVSVGEIVVVPENPVQPNSGLIGILAQVNNLQLEVSELELASDIKVYPNPTSAAINFQAGELLAGEPVLIYNNSGQLISERLLSAENSIELSDLASGIYLIKFKNKNLSTFKIIKH